MKKWLWGVMLAWVINAGAELRTWNSSDGIQTIEAEYVSLSGKEVTLKRADGRRIQVPLTRLSEADVRYVQIKNPPRLTVDGKPERLGQDLDHSIETLGNIKMIRRTSITRYQCGFAVRLEKKTAYDLPFLCRLYWFSSRLRPWEERKKEDNRDPRSVIVLSSQQWEFSLADILASKGKWMQASSEAGFIYEKETPNNRRITSLNMGWTTLQYDRYYGYLLVLLDIEGNVLAIDSDQPKLRSRVPDILKAVEEEQLFRVGLKE